MQTNASEVPPKSAALMLLAECTVTRSVSVLLLAGGRGRERLACVRGGVVLAYTDAGLITYVTTTLTTSFLMKHIR
jgi:hypothetical protein